jgi:hypothetical protein
MLTDAYAALVSIPADALKALGGIAGTAVAAGVVYAWNRIRSPRPAAEAPASRVALAPEDRDLGFTIVRTGTDLTRALHDHGEMLRRSFPRPDDDDDGGNPPAPIHRRTRVRRA